MSSLIEDVIISGITLTVDWWRMVITAAYCDRTYVALFEDIEYPNELYANSAPDQIVNLMMMPHDTISVRAFPFRNSIHIVIENDAYTIAEFWLYEN